MIESRPSRGNMHAHNEFNANFTSFPYRQSVAPSSPHTPELALTAKPTRPFALMLSWARDYHIFLTRLPLSLTSRSNPEPRSPCPCHAQKRAPSTSRPLLQIEHIKHKLNQDTPPLVVRITLLLGSLCEWERMLDVHVKV